MADYLERVLENSAKRADKNPVIGKVTRVFDKESDDIEEGNIEVNVQTRRGDGELRRVPVLLSDRIGHVSVPQKGDFVLVEFLRGDGVSPLVTATVYTDKTRSPLAREGHWRHEFGDPDEDEFVYLEAEPADGSAGDAELVRFGVKENGLSEPTTEVAVDTSGETTSVRIETDGDVSVSADGEVSLEGQQALEIAFDGDVSVETAGDATVAADGDVDITAGKDGYMDAEGDILIGDEDDATPVARADHTHSFTYSGGGDNSSTRSGTTDSPNEDGTDTKVA